MKCTVCEKTIPKKRLQALPNTDLCVKCAEDHGKPPRRAELVPDPDAPAPRAW